MVLECFDMFYTTHNNSNFGDGVLLYPDDLMVYHPSFSSNMAIQGEFPIVAHTHTMIFSQLTH